MGIWWPEVEVNKANFGKLKAGGIERTEEGELPQGRGERAWLPNSTARSPRAVLTSEKAHLQAIRQSTPGWTAAKKAHVQWKQQVARRTTRIAQVVQRLDRVGEIEEAAGVYAETKIEELAERKLS